MKPVKTRTFLDSPGAPGRFRAGFYVCLCLLLLADLAAWMLVPRHGHFPWEEVPFFNAAYGFVACVGLIFLARLLRRIVRRKEGYYD